jgi:hypothetical protein
MLDPQGKDLRDLFNQPIDWTKEDSVQSKFVFVLNNIHMCLPGLKALYEGALLLF